MAGTIGIKIANGDFYPIIDENSTIKKRLVLTTVHDRQASVQIDLFRSISKSMLDAQYMGTLIVENVRPKSKGEPSIELILSSGSDGIIAAEARDLDAGAGGEPHILNVSLKTIASDGLEDDFSDLGFDNNASNIPAGLFSQSYEKKEEVRKFPWFIMALSTLLVVIGIALLWFFFLGGRDTLRQLESQWAPLSQARQAELSASSSTFGTSPEQPPVIRAPGTPPLYRGSDSDEPVRERPPAPVSSFNVPAVIPADGFEYQIQWDDTLWDIAEAFYRTPWLFPEIAEFNNIQNPDLIFAGRSVIIPPIN
ncbi:MAG: LysM peptidoglycan-binding domain-containing protein [Treponema sp.]|nr:LysM peptidoglycan-binding domain-containing protein [Treponema sp.]